MAKRAKQQALDSFPFTVPIIRAEPRDSDAQEFIAVLSGEEPAGQRAREPLPIDRGRSADVLLRAQQRMDQIVTAAAAGALILSIAFLHYIAPSPSAGTRWVLLAGWLALAAALGSALTHHHLGQGALSGPERPLAATGGSPSAGASHPAPWLAVAASTALVVGLVCLAVFAFLNLG